MSIWSPTPQVKFVPVLASLLNQSTIGLGPHQPKNGSWDPTVEGTIDPAGNGTRIKAKIGCHLLTWLLSPALLTINAYHGLTQWARNAHSPEKRIHALEWTLGFAALILFMEIAGRWSGARKAERLIALLDSLFKDPTPNSPSKV